MNEIETDSQTEIEEGEILNIRPYAPRFSGVEWIYPDDDDDDVTHSRDNSHPPPPQDDEGTENNTLMHDNFTCQQVPYRDVDYIVDPGHVSILPAIDTVDGEIVPVKRCYLKILGFAVFDDAFPLCYLNPKIYPVLLGFMIAMVAVITWTQIQTHNHTDTQFNTPVTDGILLDLNHTDNIPATANPSVMIIPPSISPSYVPSNAPTIDMSAFNITQVIMKISGEVIWDENSPQSKALNWIISEDNMNLTYTSSNLVQRYALMVLYYSTSGDQWGDNDGYGSDRNECEWFGVECAHFHTLVSLDMFSNDLRGPLPKEVFLIPKIKHVDFGSNRLTGTIPTEIGLSQWLQDLHIFTNQLTGTIPEEIGNSPRLERINVHENLLTGTLPSSIFRLRFLSILRVSSNNLSGTIPSEISNLKLLSIFWGHRNKFMGSIPSEIGLCSFLASYIVSWNRLNGTIPLSIGNLPDLTSFSVDNNALSGTIPSTLSQLTRLNVLELHHNNNLMGSIPDDICDMSLEHLTADCKIRINSSISSSSPTSSNVFCSCCTKCY